MTPQELSEFRAKLPDCELAVYADIGARMVLAADGALRYPQEYLDAVCDAAARIFESDEDTHPSDHVLFMTATGSRAFFRATTEPTEALCCICAPSVNVTRLVDESRAALAAAENAV